MTSPVVSRVSAGFFVTIDGTPYITNGNTVFSRKHAQGYKRSLTNKYPDREVKMFGVHPLVGRS